ncbi:hypothetical protein TanjilG_20705 [Lupinus angustifolius]|uniref:Uncharacterized protein n=2 Tax=Lupinus angustifolius TaxID=3871 RepID=A0A4P1QS41_LUPAN|nr:hypothetical protein TanjilG_20705 [Lupinus angustifolius]
MVPRYKVKNNILGADVSIEELNIKHELEIEIERYLEEEIKESIYHLALKLHWIYQKRKERKNKEVSKSKALSEVNISIRIEGGTKIEIKEINKQVAERGYSRSSSRPENVKVANVFRNNKFDWVKNLRGGSRPVSVNMLGCRLKSKNRLLSTDPNVFSKCDKFISPSGKKTWQGKRRVCVEKQRQLGWKV